MADTSRPQRDTETGSYASSLDPAEGARDNDQEKKSPPQRQQSTGVSNRPLDEEAEEQQSLPPRGKSKGT